MSQLRNTPHARVLSSFSGIKRVDVSEARIERLNRHEDDQEVIRFSWWKNDNFMPQALEVTEEVLLPVLIDALCQAGFTTQFTLKLRAALNSWAHIYPNPAEQIAAEDAAIAEGLIPNPR